MMQERNEKIALKHEQVKNCLHALKIRFCWISSNTISLNSRVNDKCLLLAGGARERSHDLEPFHSISFSKKKGKRLFMNGGRVMTACDFAFCWLMCSEITRLIIPIKNFPLSTFFSNGIFTYFFTQSSSFSLKQVRVFKENFYPLTPILLSFQFTL